MNLTTPKWTQIRITARHWHFAGVAMLVLVNLILAARLAVAWRRAAAGDAAQLRQHESEYRAMQLKTRPLRGLDTKIAQAQTDEAAFYEKRFPATYSAVLTALGDLAVKNNVLLTRAQYTQGRMTQGLYPVRMDINLTGDYAPIVRFINGLERDKAFFLIEGIALSGQKNGIVTLRMKLSTFLRSQPPAADNNTAGAAPTKNSQSKNDDKRDDETASIETTSIAKPASDIPSGGQR
jgi:Tfp pilus assembly protein PilO